MSIDLDIDGLVEPYRTKVVERIRLLSRTDRERVLREASYSVVHLASADVFVDLITDSGTGAMSDEQWAGMMRGDEAYMGSRNFFHFQETVQEILGYPHVIPTHQGRAAEHIVMELLVEPGQIVLNNTHFDTTRAHVEHRKALPVDLIGDALWDFERAEPFKGNFDLARLQTALERYHDRIAFITITILNNFACSSPVSMANIREVRRLADQFGVAVYFDACRFAENAHFIKAREPGYGDRSIPEIVREMMSHGRGCWMSAKKDGLVNIGGFIAVDDAALARRCQERLVLYEGFPTYGGLAGRDLEAMAVGLEEVVDEAYLRYRLRTAEYLGEKLEAAGVGFVKPTGGHAVYLDARTVLPHLPVEQYPAWALCNALYLEGGIRGVEIGSVMFGKRLDDGSETFHTMELVRLAFPRRTYTQAHFDYVAEVIADLKQRAGAVRGIRITRQPPLLRHFTCECEWVGQA